MSAVYQFLPEEVEPGKWLVNRIPEEFPGMKGPPSRATSILKNAILPGWGMQAMGKDRRGTAFMAVYLASWAGWGIARWKRGGHIRTLNQSTNAIEQENLIRRVNRYGGIKNVLVGVAAATWLTSLVDGFTGQPDLFEFSSDGRGAGVSFRLNSR